MLTRVQVLFFTIQTSWFVVSKKFFWCFETGFLYVDQVDLELNYLPSSASGVLGLKVCATTASDNLEPCNLFCFCLKSVRIMGM